MPPSSGPPGPAPTADDSRVRREAHAAQLLANIIPYDKVATEGRLRAIHSELVYAIDRIVREQRQKPPPEAARFNDGEVEVLRSIALQIIYVLESTYRPKPGFIRGTWQEFAKQSKLAKAGIIAAIVTTLVGGAYAVLKDYWRPSESGKPAAVAPAKTVESIKPAEAPIPTPGTAPSPAGPEPKKP
jgi:hypothetical protein